MKTFELNKENLRKAWTGGDQHWFSMRDYVVRDMPDIMDLDVPTGMTQSTYLISLGYIPYFVVSNEEVMRAYVATLTNQKLKTALAKIDENNYVESFWKYANVYPQLVEGWDEFENTYVLEKAKKWCDENAINYTV